MVQQVVGRAVLLGSLAAVAVGLSGLLAWGVGSIGDGQRYVAGDRPGVTYSVARCKEYFEYAPHTTTCEQAATEHHFGEVVTYRSGAGGLGVLGLLAFLVARRRWPTWTNTDTLPSAFTETVATVAFGVAAVGLLGFAVDAALAGETPGTGAYLTGGVVAAVAALLAAARVRTHGGVSACGWTRVSERQSLATALVPTHRADALLPDRDSRCGLAGLSGAIVEEREQRFLLRQHDPFHARGVDRQPAVGVRTGTSVPRVDLPHRGRAHFQCEVARLARVELDSAPVGRHQPARPVEERRRTRDFVHDPVRIAIRGSQVVQSVAHEPCFQLR